MPPHMPTHAAWHNAVRHSAMAHNTTSSQVPHALLSLAAHCDFAPIEDELEGGETHECGSDQRNAGLRHVRRHHAMEAAPLAPV
eukprot:CAMPEP_0198491540 /NCGR_PEP_ID=MMETSP1462-20131121/2850_1 /TAXON_ID=1333877 /ORGANISM="Brandtodinium nutriculum, Strain RCC3387" /LENGTH=83 /DNA_ID=CAMNT_0044220149 /DNA_START=8 /DNA_END=256 /DNA_ORIENTATION=-